MKKRFWSIEDDAIMRAEYPNTSTKKLAEKLGVSIRSCYSRATILGLVKTSVYLATPESGPDLKKDRCHTIQKRMVLLFLEKISRAKLIYTSENH
jgi:hypothetical protein